MRLLITSVFAALLAFSPHGYAAEKGDILIFSFFRGIGQAGVYLAVSEDGVKFTPLNNDQPVMKPAPWEGQNLTRDPSVVFHDGTFHAVWTAGFRGNCFGYAESKDLVSWSEPVRVEPFPADQIPRNTWAPEICWDPVEANFMIVFSSVMMANKERGEQLFVTRTTAGKTFSPAKLFLDQKFSCIDGMPVLDKTAEGKRWVMVYKNEEKAEKGGKGLLVATAPADFSKPWVTESKPIIGPGSSLLPENMAEGPSLLKTKEGWNLYWDSPLKPAGYHMASSTDLKNWSDRTADLQLPPHPRHGTVFRAPRSAVGWLNHSKKTSARESGATLPPAPAAGDHAAVQSWTSDNGNGTFSNPLFYEDMPDPAMIRVGDDYYLTSSTLFSMPGLPILHSKDLVNWELIGYAFDRMDLNPAMRLEGRAMYSGGIWAPAFAHHNGTFYIIDTINGQGTQVYRATDPKGPWKHNEIIKFDPKQKLKPGQIPGLYDPGLLFDDDGRVYAVHGRWDIYITELNADLTAVIPGSERLLIPKSQKLGEGSHFYKINGKYMIVGTNPGAHGALNCARADQLTGPWETTIICKESMGIGFSRGDVNLGEGLTLHQGGIIDTPTGEWWSYIMTDHNGIGRLTCLAPVTWTDGWPMVGLPGNLTRTPRTWIKPKLPVQPIRPLTVRSDDFSAGTLQPFWEWNHLPDDSRWSLTERPGFLRLHALPAPDLKMARNTLTQKAIGPESTVTVELDAAGMQPGDVAGLALFKFPYAWIGVGKTTAGYAVQLCDQDTQNITSTPLQADHLWFRAHCNFDTDIGELSYSTDGTTFLTMGKAVDLTFNTKTFQGIRYSLFHFNTTGKAGGYADFDRFTVDEPRARGLTRPIPVGKAVTFTSMDKSAVLAVKDGVVQTVPSSQGATAFTVIDRNLGRVALATPSGEWVSVGATGKPGAVTLKTGTPSDAETFQWVDMQRGDLMLMSLVTHRYLATATNKPATTGPVGAERVGTRPDRLDGVCWIWTITDKP